MTDGFFEGARSGRRHAKEALSRACRDIVEDLLRKTYVEEGGRSRDEAFAGDGGGVRAAEREAATQADGDDDFAKTQDTATTKECMDQSKSVNTATKKSSSEQTNALKIPKPHVGVGGDESSAEDMRAVGKRLDMAPAFEEDAQDIPPIDEEVHGGGELGEMIENISDNVREAMECRRSLRQRTSRNYQHFVPLESELAALPTDASFVEHLPHDLGYLINYVQGQGDNHIVEGIVQQGDERRGNVVVNVNFSDYTKIIVLLFTVNTLILLKMIFWDQLAQLLLGIM